MKSDAHEPFGKMTKHLGEGVFEIETPYGEYIVAQVLPKPGVMDYYGCIVSAEAVEEVAPQLIGKPVYAKMWPQ